MIICSCSGKILTTNAKTLIGFAFRSGHLLAYGVASGMWLMVDMDTMHCKIYTHMGIGKALSADRLEDVFLLKFEGKDVLILTGN